MKWSNQPTILTGSWGTDLASAAVTTGGPKWFSWNVAAHVTQVATNSMGAVDTRIGFAAVAGNTANPAISFSTRETDPLSATLTTVSPDLSIATSAVPADFFEAHCKTCHGVGLVNNSWENGSQGICYNPFGGTGGGVPLRSDLPSIEGRIPGMLDADDGAATNGAGRPHTGTDSNNNMVTKGGTTGCRLESRNDCTAIVKPLAKYIYETLCGNAP